MADVATPKPWRIKSRNGYGELNGVNIGDGRGYILATAIGDVPELDSEANADLIVRAVNAHDALVEAAEANRAWAYAEHNGVGTFEQHQCLCPHAESLTLEALAIVSGDDAPEYKGVVGMTVWPTVERTETDRETGRALVAQVLGHERAALAQDAGQ